MSDIRFWDSWHKGYKNLFQLLGITVIVTLSLFWIAYFVYPAPLLTWEHFQLLETESVPVKNITVGLFDFSLSADNNLVYESMLGGVLQPEALAYYFFLVIILISSLVMLTIVTTLSRFWFLMGTGIFILFLASLRMETLQLFGFEGKVIPGIIIFIYIALAFLFQSFRKQTGFIARLLTFVLTTITIGVVIYVGSPIVFPFLQLSASAISFGLIITLIFIFLVAHEIIGAIIGVVSQRQNNPNSLRHFGIFSIVYVLNLLLTYFQTTGFITWGVYTINLFLLLSISAVLAVWGFRQREEQYRTIISADPFGVYLMVSLFLIAFGSISFFFLSGNDPAIKLIKDMILYSHLGYGIIFIMYIISNFGPMLQKNLPVYRVLYKPTTMPYFTFRIMGLIASYVFLAYNTNWNSLVDYGLSAYYNGRGDVYYIAGDETSSLGYFKRANFYRESNHHGHYALATINAALIDPYNERAEYAKACEYAPTPYAYINLSDTYERSQDFDVAARILKTGLRKFPDSGPLANALGLVFTSLKMPDSAIYYFQVAKENGLTDVASTNLLAQSNRIRTAFPADSLFRLLGSDAEGTKSNALALANTQQTTIDITIDEALEDTTLTAYSAALISNYLINQREKIDTAFIGKALALALRPVNENFREPIQFAAGHAYYAQGQVNKAFRLVRQLAYLSSSGKYHQVLGVWSLEQHNALMAYDYFEKAQERRWSNAEFSRAIALADADSNKLAQEAWEKIKARGDSASFYLADGMLNVLRATPNRAMQFTDEDKYRYCRYTLSMFDARSFELIVNSMTDEELKAKALYDMSWNWFELDEPQIAADLLAQTIGLSMSDPAFLSDIRYLNLLLVAANKNWTALQENISKLPFEGIHKTERIYLEALLDEQNGRTEEAEKKYKSLMTSNAQFEDGIAAAIEFLSKSNSKDTYYHQLLIDALLIKPNSVKLLKAYAKESARIGFGDEAINALNRLRERLSLDAFKKFITENPQAFAAE